MFSFGIPVGLMYILRLFGPCGARVNSIYLYFSIRDGSGILQLGQILNSTSFSADI